MSGKIFSDADMTVRVERNPVLDTPQGKKQFDGLVYQMTCQICETPTKTGIAWREIRLLLDGGLTQGV